MTPSLLQSLQDLQEIQREGWMPEATHEASREAEIARMKRELKEARDALAECDAYLMRYDSNAGGTRRTIKRALTASR